MKKLLVLAVAAAISSSAISEFWTSALGQAEKCEGQPCSENAIRQEPGHGKINCEGPCTSTSSATAAAKPTIFCHWKCPKEVLFVNGKGDCGAVVGITGTCEKAKLPAVPFPGKCGDVFAQCTFDNANPGDLIEVNSCRCRIETSTSTR